MLTIHASSLRASPGEAQSPQGGAAPLGAGDPAAFASLLRQNQATPNPAPVVPTAPAPKPAPTETATAEAPAGEPEAPRDTEAGNRNRAQSRSKARSAEGASATPRDTPAAPGSKDTPVAADDAPDAANDAAPTEAKAAVDPTMDPSTLQWLAGLQRVVSGRADDVAPDAGTSAPTAETEAPLGEARGHAKAHRPADLVAEGDLKDKAAQGRVQLADAANARQFAGVLAEQHRAEKPAPPFAGAVDRTHETAAMSAGAFAPAPGAGTAATSTPTVPIAAPVHAPDFAHELGLRLAVLAVDGVQTAELHLNPAEMGPVSVQIVMDGTQARIDFGADVAATRQAIEAGLPELASALADAGFTLAGGGVSQHAGGRSGGNEPGAPEGQRARGLVVEDEVKRVAAAAQRVVTRGGVDVFV